MKYERCKKCNAVCISNTYLSDGSGKPHVCHGKQKPTLDLDFAKHFMEKAHEGQKRWDGKPYSFHPEKVVNILETLFNCKDKAILCAAYLHDVLEDTNVPAISIEDHFGPDVLSLVKELTHQSTSTEEYVAYCTRLSGRAQLIKIADILANITDEGQKSDHFIRKRVAALKVMI